MLISLSMYCCCKKKEFSTSFLWMNEWMNEKLNEWTIEWMNEWTIEWTNEWMNDWMNDWMNEWMNERLSERTNERSIQQKILNICMKITCRSFLLSMNRRKTSETSSAVRIFLKSLSGLLSPLWKLQILPYSYKFSLIFAQNLNLREIARKLVLNFFTFVHKKNQR